MPRRRARNAKSTVKLGPRSVNKKESKIAAWNKLSDIPLDEEDQFHVSRDKILLEGEEEASDDDRDEDEVFALDDLGVSSEDDGSGKEFVESEDVGNAKEKGTKSPKKKTSRKSITKDRKKRPGASDSESTSESEEEETWGKKSAYYSSNAALLDSDDSDANEMEEQEARRLQAKIRESMRDDDFGLGDVPEVTDVDDGIVQAALQSAPALPQDKQSLLQQLEKTCPETLALAHEWDDVAHSIMKTEAKLAKIEATSVDDESSLGMIHLYHHAQLTYASVLAFYLHLRASEKYALRPDLLKFHPILSRLLTLKQSLSTLEDLNFDMSDSSEGDLSDAESIDIEDDFISDARELWGLTRKGHASEELKGLLQERVDGTQSLPSPKKSKENGTEKSNKKQRSSRMVHHPPPIFDLVEPEFMSTESSRVNTSTMDPYGEATALDSADAADKGARRKTLRFHTSKIESASSRRQGARNAIAGDDDIPYRERKRGKIEKPVRKGLGEGGEDLDDSEPAHREDTKKRGRSELDDEDGGDDGGYYDLVRKQKREKKDRDKAEYEAEKEAARPNFGDEATSGQRTLTRAILANKGLTPHRSKSVRNPRVKKRQRFEKAKKKVASQKAIYKGGIGETGRYEGEKSGISRVVKSIKL